MPGNLTSIVEAMKNSAGGAGMVAKQRHHKPREGR